MHVVYVNMCMCLYELTSFNVCLYPCTYTCIYTYEYVICARIFISIQIYMFHSMCSRAVSLSHNINLFLTFFCALSLPPSPRHPLQKILKYVFFFFLSPIYHNVFKDKIRRAARRAVNREGNKRSNPTSRNALIYSSSSQSLASPAASLPCSSLYNKIIARVSSGNSNLALSQDTSTFIRTLHFRSLALLCLFNLAATIYLLYLQ